MASQSPAEAPTDPALAGEALPYVRAWEATTELLRLGHNWSGHEANVCFLNTHASSFVDVSSVSGIDFIDDTRGVAVVDWDRDGDLDLWWTNRTSPRVRYLQNEGSAENHFVALKLRGTTCNRDAVGARVELHRGSAAPGVLIQSLRAGEGYLAQSSKAIHFGLGSEARIEKVVVRWPGGAAEEFRGLAAGDYYELVQGEGAARRLDRPEKRSLASRPPEAMRESSPRIKSARRLPLPALEASMLSGERLALNDALTGPRLILLWAPWCEPCLVELAELAKNKDRLRAGGVEVLPINVDAAKPDAAQSPAEAAEVLKRLGFDGRSGLATVDLLDRLDIAQRILTNKPFPPPIPSSFLLDASGRLVCVYKGPVKIDQLLEDVRDLAATPADPRDAAVPFAGRWFTNAFPPDLVAIPNRLLQIGQPQAAVDYLDRAAARHAADHAEFASVLAHQLAATYVSAAKSLTSAGKLDDALPALEKAVAIQNDNGDARFGLAAIYSSRGEHRAAAEQYRALLALRPRDPMVSRSLAWILANTQDATLRDPTEAVRLAQIACEASQYRDPGALDALAAAYAAAGRFDEAVSTARQAIEILRDAGQPQPAAAMQERLRLYEQRKVLGSE